MTIDGGSTHPVPAHAGDEIEFSINGTLGTPVLPGQGPPLGPDREAVALIAEAVPLHSTGLTPFIPSCAAATRHHPARACTQFSSRSP